MANIDDETLTQYSKHKTHSLFSGLSEPHSVLDQMWMDDISLPPITEFLREWKSRNPNVCRITLGYSRDQYFIAFSLGSLSIRSVREHIRKLNDARKLFKDFTFIVYPLGPQQSGSLLLNSIEVYDVI